MTSVPPTRVPVVVITRDRRDSLVRTLRRLRAAPDVGEVVVVDNGSRDGGPDMAERLGARVIRLWANRGSAARNAGVAAVDGPVVAFADDDSWWRPGALARAAALIAADPAVGAVAGRVLVGPEAREDPVCRLMAASPLGDTPAGPRVLGFLACGAVVRRSAFLDAGGFHPRLGVGGEEELLAVDLARRGWAIAYAADVVAHHHPAPRAESSGRRRRQARNALWAAWLRRRPRAVAARTARAVRAAARDRDARAGLVAAAAGLVWVIRERRVVDAELEERLRLLDGRGTRLPDAADGYPEEDSKEVSWPSGSSGSPRSRSR